MKERNIELILPKLRCVSCGADKLHWDRKENKLICRKCGKKYEIIEGIPIMIEEDVRRKHNVKVFDEHSKRYDSWFERDKGSVLYQIELAALKEAIRVYNFEDGVEIGVGSGRFASKIGVEFGVDPSIELLKIAVKRGIRSVLGVAEETPFKSNTFDFALIMFSICFLENGEKAISEVDRILRKNGLFAIGFIPKNSKWGDFYIEKGRRGAIFYQEIRLYTEEEIKEIAKNHDLEIIKRIGTLTQPPGERIIYEEPREEGDFSFVVHLYKKTH